MADEEPREQRTSAAAPEARASVPPSIPPSIRRRARSPFTWLVLLAFAGIAFFVSGKAPKEQHVRFVLGAAAPRLTRLTCDYEPVGGADGVARAAEFTYDHGDAPRVLAHDPELVSGDYVLHIRVFSKDGQNTLERPVTFSSGTVSVDLADAVPGPPLTPVPASSVHP